MNKQTLYKWHSLAGIKLSILICFILITGTFATISHEIDWLTNASQRVSPSVNASEINWSNIYQAAQQQNANDPISSIHAPIDDWFAVEVIKLDDDAQRYRQFYHPVTGEYQGEGRWYNWQRFFRMSHRHLMMPTIYGVTIVGIVGLVMFFSLISGFFLLPKWWRYFFRKPRTNNRKTFWNDCHRLFGLWSSWLLLVVCLTSIWYLLELWGLNATFPEQAMASSHQVEESIEETEIIKLAPATSILTNVINSVPDHHNIMIKSIIFPNAFSTVKERVIIIQGQNDTVLVRDRANNIIFDITTGQYLSRRLADQQSAHVRISEAADPLHFGVWAGIYSKIIYFIFGLILSALAISGTYLYGLRHYRTHRNEQTKITKIWYSSWQGMNRWKWLCIVLITISFLLTGVLFSNYILI